MKITFSLALLAFLTFACNPGAPNLPAAATTVDSAAAPIETSNSASTQPTDPVNIPQRGPDWIDHNIDEMSPKVVISTPKGVEVFSNGSSINVQLNEHHSMYIESESLDMRKEKQWYLDSDSRENLKWLIDTDSEKLYTGTDLSAPKGHQNTNSFFAVKRLGNQDFSTNVDGILIEDEDHVFNLSMQDCQLLLGIFRTLRVQ